jgi:hypothetical protein
MATANRNKIKTVQYTGPERVEPIKIKKTDMTKRLFTLALIAGCCSLVACSSEPSDFRPENKVSLDAVPPGTRTSPNLDNAADRSQHDQQQEVQLNHDEHTNVLEESQQGAGKKEAGKEERTVVKDSVENHE